jgi:hypothetical protein
MTLPMKQVNLFPRFCSLQYSLLCEVVIRPFPMKQVSLQPINVLLG